MSVAVLYLTLLLLQVELRHEADFTAILLETRREKSGMLFQTSH